ITQDIKPRGWRSRHNDRRLARIGAVGAGMAQGTVDPEPRKTNRPLGKTNRRLATLFPENPPARISAIPAMRQVLRKQARQYHPHVVGQAIAVFRADGSIFKGIFHRVEILRLLAKEFIPNESADQRGQYEDHQSATKPKGAAFLLGSHKLHFFQAFSGSGPTYKARNSNVPWTIVRVRST